MNKNVSFREAHSMNIDQSIEQSREEKGELEMKNAGSLNSIAEEIRSCNRCSLAKERTRAVPGEGPGNAEILLIGEAPGRDEDHAGRPFVGRAGSILDRCLEEAGIERGQVFITNAVKCRPPKNRRPKKDEIEACRPYLEAQIGLVQPKVVILMGNAATKAVLEMEGVTSLRGQVYRDLFLITFHPAAVLRNGNLKGALVLDLLAAKEWAEG